MCRQTACHKRISSSELFCKNNLQYEINNQQVKKETQIKTATALPKTGVFAENEDMAKW